MCSILLLNLLLCCFFPSENSLFKSALTVRRFGYIAPPPSSAMLVLLFILDLFGLLILHIHLCMLSFEHTIPFMSMSGNIFWKRNRRPEPYVSNGRSTLIGRHPGAAVCVLPQGALHSTCVPLWGTLILEGVEKIADPKTSTEETSREF